MKLMARLTFGLVRDFESGEFFEKFLVSAVFSILAIRTFLHIFGYPQLGEGHFHIAHILWGGFLMMFAIVLLLGFLNRAVKSWAAIFGGLGFGMFIDELGKFVTSDNDYFFRPTIALVYVVFIMLFLMFRGIERYFRFSHREYTANALEVTKEAIIHNLDEEEKKRVLVFLARSDASDPLVPHLKNMLSGLEVIPDQKGMLDLLALKFRKILRKIMAFPLFPQVVVGLFVLVAIFSFIRSFLLLSSTTGFAQWGELGSSVLVGVFVVLGIYKFSKSRLEAYEMFKVAIMISIFLTQFFEFWTEQLSALFGLVVGIFILTATEYLIHQQRLTERD